MANPDSTKSDDAQPAAETPSGLWNPSQAPARVRRRFSMKSMLMIVFCYSAGFALLASLNTLPSVFAGLMTWFTLVGLGQALLFGGCRPRLASVVAGAVAAFPSMLVVWIVDGGRQIDGGALCFFLLPATIFGAAFGYLAGGLAAGAFLLTATKEERDEDEKVYRQYLVEHERKRLEALARYQRSHSSFGNTLMTDQPTLETTRLILRPLAAFDAPEIRHHAGDVDVAATTLKIPHPYPEGEAERWIARCQALYAAGKTITFGIVLKSESRLIGTIELRVDRGHKRGDMGYFIGKDYWSEGYATEAAAEILRFGFSELDLHRMMAHCFSRNLASARVLDKIGMRYEGLLREHVIKWERHEDVRVYGILAEDVSDILMPEDVSDILVAEDVSDILVPEDVPDILVPDDEDKGSSLGTDGPAI